MRQQIASVSAASYGAPVVESYPLRARNGKPIRRATLVRFPDRAAEVRFIERLPRAAAIAQALALLTSSGDGDEEGGSPD